MEAQTTVGGRARSVRARNGPGTHSSRGLALLLAAGLLVAPAAVTRATDTPAPDAPTAGDLAPDLSAEIDALADQVRDLTAERDRLRSLVGRLEGLYAELEADRLLLVELRKEVPQGRDEAETYLARLRDLALSADPARLGVISERVMQAAPVWLDWRDQPFTSQVEASEAYVRSGASAFDAKLAEFRDAILLTVASRLDGLLNMIDRVR
jgi:hypothetical protein